MLQNQRTPKPQNLNTEGVYFLLTQSLPHIQALLLGDCPLYGDPAFRGSISVALPSQPAASSMAAMAGR